MIWGGAQFLNGGPETYLADGAAYDPNGDNWRVIAEAPLSAREGQLGVWTGTEAIVWGGRAEAGKASDGAAYDPTRDRWRPIADAPFSWQPGATALWTGAEAVVAAAQPRDRLTVAAYEPVSDTWRTLPPLAAPSGSGVHLAWTGRELVLLDPASGMWLLEPAADAWTSIELSEDGGGPLGPIRWTGGVIAAVALEYVAELEGYRHFVVAWDPASNTWLDLPPPSSPLADLQRILWADNRVLLFGVGSAFDTEAKEWLALRIPWLNDRLGGIVVWAGDRLVVWGGAPHSETPSESHAGGFLVVPAW